MVDDILVTQSTASAYSLDPPQLVLLPGPNPDNGYVTLRWNWTEGIADPDLDTFTIQYSLTSGGPIVDSFDTGLANTFKVGPLGAGTYFFSVRYQKSDPVGNPIPGGSTSEDTVIVITPDQGDADGDGVADNADNCPNNYNPGQKRTHGTSSPLGDACYTPPNATLALSGPTAPVAPGDSVWVTASFTNNTGAPITTIRPDCFNTLFKLTDPSGNVIEPPCRVRAPYGIPKDVVTIGAGQPFSVTCDITEIYPPEFFTLDAGGHTVTATYQNDIQDPDFNPVINPVTGCPSGVPCLPLDQVVIPAANTITFDVSATLPAVQKVPVNVVFNPSQWDLLWGSVNGPQTIEARIGNLGCGVPIGSIGNILLNGTVPSISAKFIAGCVLSVVFDRTDAVRSLGTSAPGTTVFPTVEGKYGTTLFTGKGAVALNTNHGTLTLLGQKVILGKNTRTVPLPNMEVNIFDKSVTAPYGLLWPLHLGEIWRNNQLEPHIAGLTLADGLVKFDLAPGDYIAIGRYKGGFSTTLPFRIVDKKVEKRVIFFIQTPDGRILPGN